MDRGLPRHRCLRHPGADLRGGGRAPADGRPRQPATGATVTWNPLPAPRFSRSPARYRTPRATPADIAEVLSGWSGTRVDGWLQSGACDHWCWTISTASTGNCPGEQVRLGRRLHSGTGRSSIPDSFAICLATSDGYVYEAGDSRKRFAIQSVSKPFTYALALADRGLAAVAAKVDVEPSGEPFNEISLDPITERPRNPMINAGAITCASLIAGDSPEERFERLRKFYSSFAGRDLALDEDMFASEDRTGNRNRAIGYMLRSFGILDEDPQTTLAVYFRQCSIEVDCRDLSLMAATLADSGVNPVTNERVLDPALTERVLSVMTTCGMYNAAGDWVTEVGLPAKSGVGGGILAVLPGQIGLAVFSPRLDEHGNSVRGVQACRRLSKDLELHFMHVSRAARSAVRASYDVVEAPSRRRRSPQEQAVLLEYGRRARVYELHGDLLFAGAESVIREITARAGDLDVIVLDIRGVDETAEVSRRLLLGLRDQLRTVGGEAVMVDPSRRR